MKKQAPCRRDIWDHMQSLKDRFDVRKPGTPQTVFSWVCVGWMLILVAINYIYYGPISHSMLARFGIATEWSKLVILVERFLVGDFLGR